MYSERRVFKKSRVVVVALIVLGAALLTWPAVALGLITEKASPAGSSASISSNGRYVAFESDSATLVGDDTNGHYDVFVRDLVSGTTVRVSVSGDEVQGNGWSGSPAISGDGRYVAFRSLASNLVSDDTNGISDVFVRDLVEGTTVRASVSSDEVQGDGASLFCSISANGRFVAFESAATNLVGADSNGKKDTFVRDLVDGTTERVSVSSDEAEGDNTSGYSTSLSADGRYVAFMSYATNLVDDDTNGLTDAFVRDRVDGTTTRVSVATDGTQTSVHWGAEAVDISDDGRYVAFYSYASQLVPDDTNGSYDVFVHDTVTGTTTRVDVTSAGAQTYGAKYPSISGDGRYVAFATEASNVVPNDTNFRSDIFVHDRQTGVTQRVSVTPVGGQADDFSDRPSMSSDGGHVAFTSAANNLVTGDDGVNGIYVVSDFSSTNIYSVTPAHGSPVGGDSVVIKGSNFVGVTSVTFGGVPATSYVVDSQDQITAVAPAHSAGLVQVQVTAVLGPTEDTSSDDFEYVGPPTISGITPATGLTTGYGSVVITGTNFSAVTGTEGVTFGGVSAVAYTVDSLTQITATVPYHAAGVVRVRVTAGGIATADTPADDYTYVQGQLAQARATEWVSIDREGTAPDGQSRKSSVSADGRYVAFESWATDLTSPDDTNAKVDIYLRDLTTGTTTRVTKNSDDQSYNPSVSADGRYIAFEARYYLVPNSDWDGLEDIIVYDTVEDEYYLASADTKGDEANAPSYEPSISADGRYVAFSSFATDLVPGDLDGWDIFVRDCKKDKTELISVSTAGVHANGRCDDPSISADGRYVAFVSEASNLVSGDTNGKPDIFLRDRQLGTTIRVSVSSTGVQGRSGVMRDGVSISADGRYVTYCSGSSNLVAGDTNSAVDVFVYDRVTRTTSRVSVSSSGVQGNGIGCEDTPVISADGRYVAFMSYSSNLVAGDTNNRGDIFVRDRSAGTTTRVSTGSGGVQSNGFSTEPAMSADGKCVVFESEASNLAAGDTNAMLDIYSVVGVSRYQQTDSRLTYLGKWTSASTWSASGGSFASTAQPGAALIAKFTGTEVTLLSRTTPWYGEAEIYVDGTLEDTVDLYSATTVWKAPIWSCDTLSAGEHTLVIKCTGEKNLSSGGTSIALDALDILGYLEQAAQITRIDDNDASYATYDPAWSRWDESGYWAAYMDTYAFTDKTGDKATVTFEGTYFSWVSRTANTQGKAQVTLYEGATADPAKQLSTQPVDLYSRTTSWKKSVYNTGLLPDGTYTVVIECLGQKNWASWWYSIGVDAFDVMETTL